MGAAASVSERRSVGVRDAVVIVLVTVLVNAALAVALRAAGQARIGTAEYDAIAANLAAGHGFVLEPGGTQILWRPPLYIYFLAGIYKLFANPYAVVVGCQVVFNVLTGLLTYAAGRRLYGRPVGLLAAILLGGYPLFGLNCARLMPEAMFALLLAAITWFVVSWHAGRWSILHAVGLGLLLGVASLTKASVQFFAPFLLVWSLCFLRRVRPWRAAVLHTGVMLGTMLLVLSPWVVRNARVAGEFILVDTSGGYTFWIGNRVASDGLDDDPLDNEAWEDILRDVARILDVEYKAPFDVSETAWASGEASRKLLAEGIRNALRQPFATVLLSFRKIHRFWFAYVGGSRGVQPVVYVLQAGVLLPAGLGLLLAVRRRKRTLGLLSVVTYFTLLHMAATSNVRYSFPLLPHVLLFTATGLLWVAQRFRPRRQGAA
jgi:4-amino-4-deoxy-L-arabinose transferase-like glycosyltransferase